MSILLILLLLVIATLLSATGMLCLKLSSPNFSLRPRRMLRNKTFILGGVLYALSLAVYLFVLKAIPVSIAYPLTSMNYVWTAVLSKKYLGERVDAWRWGGVGLIIVGIVLLAL